MTQEFHGHPSLVLGLGGTGVTVATWVKKAILEITGNRWMKGVRVLGVDTEGVQPDGYPKFRLGGWGKVREVGSRATGPVALGPGEYLYLGGNVRELAQRVYHDRLEKGGQYTHIYRWWRVEQYLNEPSLPETAWNLTEGAAQYRQFGLIALYNGFQEFRNVVGALLRDIYSDAPDPKKVVIHVVASFVGGTGSGMAFHAAHLARQIALHDVGFSNVEVVGYFVLPEGFEGTGNVMQKGKVQGFRARAYAALREMDRLQSAVSLERPYRITFWPFDRVANGQLEKGIFDNIYLIDGKRSTTALNMVPLSVGIAPTIADAVMTLVDDVAGGDVRSHLVNVYANRASYGIPETETVVGALGAYTVELPMYHIVEGWAHKLARSVMSTFLQPEIDPKTQRPSRLRPDHPGERPGLSGRQEVDKYLNQASEKFSDLIFRVWGWGQLYGEEQTKPQVEGEINSYTPEQWADLLRLDRDANTSRRLMRAIRADLTKKEVIEGEENPYYVDPNPGGTDEAQARQVRTQVEHKMTRLLGAERPDGTREGGELRSLLQAERMAQEKRFRSVIVGMLEEILNGSPTEGPIAARAGKLGFTIDLLQAMQEHFHDAVRALESLEGINLREIAVSVGWGPFEEVLSPEEARKRMDEKPSKGNRKAYIKAKQAELDAHKLDIIRRVVREVAQSLVLVLDELLEKARQWEEVLATKPASKGGLYALIQEGEQANRADREESSKVLSREVIEDAEWEERWYNHYVMKGGEPAAERLVGAFRWKVEVGERGADLHLEFAPSDEERVRFLKDVEVREAGERNLRPLLRACRQVFEPAWEDLSVTHYLIERYQHNPRPLIQKLKEGSGAVLDVVTDAGAMPALFLRIHEQSRSQAEQHWQQEGFIDHLVNALATELRVDVAPRRGDEGALKRGFGTSPGQDRFKMTLLYLQNLHRLEKVKGYSGVYRNDYRGFGGRPEQLHVFAAEENASRYEQLAREKLHQPQREFAPRVVMLMEDLDRLRLAAKALVYGNKDVVWGDGEESGLLLYLGIPYANTSKNRDNKQAWILTTLPDPLYDNMGRLRSLNHYLLTDFRKEEPSTQLIDAIEQFIYRPWSVDNKALIFSDSDVERTLEFAIREDARQRLASGTLGWEPEIGIRGKVLENAVKMAAQAQTYDRFCKEWEEKVHQEYDANAPLTLREEWDLYTVLYLLIDEEKERLMSNLGTLGRTTSVPINKQPRMQSIRLEPQQPQSISEAKSQARPVAESTDAGRSTPEAATTATIKCPHCGQEHPTYFKACPMTGEPLQPAPKACPHCGEEHPPEFKFCPVTALPL